MNVRRVARRGLWFLIGYNLLCVVTAAALMVPIKTVYVLPSIQITIYLLLLYRNRLPHLEDLIQMRNRRGFTLPEILVTITLIAVLAAVVVPAVASHVGKGDTSSLQQNSVTARAAIEAFMADVRRYPLKPTQLVKAIGTSDKDLNGNTYTTYYTNLWHGPYMQKDSTSFFGSGSWAYGTLVDTFAIKTLNGNKYMTLMATGLNHDALNNFDLSYDGAADSTAGNITYKKDTLWFLVYPIAK